MLKISFIALFTFVNCFSLFAAEVSDQEVQKYKIDENREFIYKKPSFSEIAFSQIPKTFVDSYHNSFNKDNLWNIAAITLSTLLLIEFDDELIEESKKIGQDLGIGNDDHTTTMLKAGDFNIFRGPTDLGSWLYFLGDGWMNAAMSASFVTYGKVTDDYRAVSTGYQIVQSMIVNTIVNQFLKRTTGRQSPIRVDVDGRVQNTGRWVIFPNQNDYNEDVSNYDAFPSGHVQVTTATWVVIIENYPEYAHILKPVAYTWLSLLAFQMMNNRVHWASDYPLAIGLGLVIGKAIAKQNRTEKVDPAMTTFWDEIDYNLIATPGRLGLRASYDF